jgi:hypothetical protein
MRREFLETARAVATATGVARWQLAYQSRSGNPRGTRGSSPT